MARLRRSLDNHLFFLFAAQVFLLAIGVGSFIVRYGFNKDLFDAQMFSLRLLVILMLTWSAVYVGRLCFQKSPQLFFFRTMLAVTILFATLYSANAVSHRFIPGWPNIGLHGVRLSTPWWEPDGKTDGGFNSWGQRDKERSLTPPPSVTRVAFVGDSFLEKPQVLSHMVEDKLNSPSIEIVNLGVSASGPDEYYYRTKNIALKMGIKKCYLFFYAFNDFIETPTLKSIGGLVAVYPRDSLLTVLGLTSLNHVLTNFWRPFYLGDASNKERETVRLWQNHVETDNDTDLRKFMVGRLAPEYQARAARKLADPRSKQFLEMMRRPDGDLLRIYYVMAGLRYAGGQKTHHMPYISEVTAYRWVKLTADLCRKNDIEFTLVVIPEAFQVDKRMQEQYAVLGDMKEYFAPIREASGRLVKRARADGIRTIRLGQYLDDIPGTYLNMDGHWSDKGFGVVSDVMVKALKQS